MQTVTTKNTPVIKLELHQRTALDHVRDTETFTLVSYANNQLALDTPSEYATLIATIEVDRPYIYAGSNQEWRREVLGAAMRKAFELGLAWKHEGAIYADYRGV